MPKISKTQKVDNIVTDAQQYALMMLFGLGLGLLFLFIIVGIALTIGYIYA